MQQSQVETDSVTDVPPHRTTELADTGTSGSGGKHRKRKPPKITVKSAPGKPLDLDMEPIDAVRLVSAFGTAEPSFASLDAQCHHKRSLRRGPSAPTWS